MASTAELRELLRTTSLPPSLVEDLLAGASTVWLLSDRAKVLAGDLAMCHPPLRDGEIRASVRSTSTPHTWRVSIVAPDRVGLLAAVAGVMAEQDLSITRTSATACGPAGLAVMSVTVTDPAQRVQPPDWDGLGDRLRAVLGGGEAVAASFRPAGPVRATVTPGDGAGILVSIDAPDGIGLLWAAATFLAEHGVNIEAVRLRSVGGRAETTLVVDGTVDMPALVRRLSGQSAATGLLPFAIDLATWPLRVTAQGARQAARLIRR